MTKTDPRRSASHSDWGWRWRWRGWNGGEAGGDCHRGAAAGRRTVAATQRTRGRRAPVGQVATAVIQLKPSHLSESTSAASSSFWPAELPSGGKMMKQKKQRSTTTTTTTTDSTVYIVCTAVVISIVVVLTIVVIVIVAAVKLFATAFSIASATPMPPIEN
ncbi:hypothetical protein LSTR_LSTR012124 [Laodelphax striatellus]|uniref:Uncharacterized protein n=1 Tax=Laodelphax striatellus TaxID=195883 RepID=A0A482XUQ2_LAOST|nr:hypothetical protein LSTR_LSTR012124 [Laodelphax striatellus]